MPNGESYNKSVGILQKGIFQRNSVEKTAHIYDLKFEKIIFVVLIPSCSL
jgi:hypothetical protein